MEARRFLRDNARRYVYPVLESFWGMGFRATRAFQPHGNGVRPWTSDGGLTVTIVAPHPDDETLGAGGVAVLHRLAGDAVTAVVVTDGGASRAGGHSPPEMARMRAAEVENACRILGADLVRLGFKENAWAVNRVSDQLAPLVERADIVYAPSCIDFHPEHVRTARTLAEIVRPESVVRVYEIGVPLTSVLVNLVADISDVANIKAKALDSFETQLEGMLPLRRMARYRQRRHGLDAVETFWEMSGKAYRHMMEAEDWLSGVTRFRSIRSIPISDPLAFLVGRTTRHKLRRTVGLSDEAAARASSHPKVVLE